MALPPCPRCGVALRDEDVMTELGVAHCDACDHTFDLPAAEAPAALQAPRSASAGRDATIPHPPTQAKAQQVDVTQAPGRYEALFHYDLASENMGCGCASLVAAIGIGGALFGWCGDASFVGLLVGALAALGVAREGVTLFRWGGRQWTVTFTESHLESAQGSHDPVRIPWSEVARLVHEDERLLGLQHWVYAVDAAGARTAVVRVHQDTAKWFVAAASLWTGRTLATPEKDDA